MPVHNHTIRFERLAGTRIAALPAALDAITWPDGTIVLRLAPDEVYATPPLADQSAVTAHDEHAIILDEGAFSGAWIEAEAALALLAQHCQWEIPSDRPTFCQGAVAGIPTRLWLTEGNVLFMVQTPYAHELEARLI